MKNRREEKKRRERKYSKTPLATTFRQSRRQNELNFDWPKLPTDRELACSVRSDRRISQQRADIPLLYSTLLYSTCSY